MRKNKEWVACKDFSHLYIEQAATIWEAVEKALNVIIRADQMLRRVREIDSNQSVVHVLKRMQK